ncbi:hypothetical protein [Pedobacter agri]|uniref:hypothetical protein n=1 Tax=Pedobacter agri TaxID=454586 RepID=UPI00292CC88E|nr:hypothetical protein [Pedobacter agri]
MKIFNLEPITVKEYIFNKSFLAQSHSSHSSSYGFDFDCKVIDSQKTMIITFEILHTVGDGDYEEEIFFADGPNELLVVGSSTVAEGAGDILMSYKSSCQFNLENEGYDVDILSLIDFLTAYHVHTQKFLDQYGFKSFGLPEEAFFPHNILSNAKCAIENLLGSHMYEF